MKFLVFWGFTGYTETSWNIWNKIANNIDKFYKKLKLNVKKDQFEAFLSDFDSEDTLMREKEVVKAGLKAADELMSDAKSKLHDALSATAVNIWCI